MPLEGPRGVAKPPCRKWVSEFSDPFESLFLSHIIYMYYRVYLQVFICRKWVIFPCLDPTRGLSDPQPELMAHRILCWWVIVKIPGNSLISRDKKIIKGHNLMDLCIFYLKNVSVGIIGFIYKFSSVENELSSLASMQTWEKDVHLHFVSGTKFYYKIFVWPPTPCQSPPLDKKPRQYQPTLNIYKVKT
jgi:hypothetical protein